MSVDEAAEFLGVDRNTVYDYAGRGVIPHRRLGKRILFSRQALVVWLAGECRSIGSSDGEVK
jgi:excisionase family DNA binding protein